MTDLVKQCNLNLYLQRVKHFDNHSIIFYHWDHSLQKDYVNAYKTYNDLVDHGVSDLNWARKRYLQLEELLELRDKYQTVEDMSARVRWCKTGYRNIEKNIKELNGEVGDRYLGLMHDLTQAESYVDRAVSDYLLAKSQFFQSLNQDERILYQQIWKEECW